MNYYNEIKYKLLECEAYDRVKDYSKDRNKVNTYYETGKLLNDAGKEYGKNIIREYSIKLMKEVGTKYNERTLYGMRKFYQVFSNEKLNTACSILTWSHYREVLSLKDINAIMYYLNECENKKLTVKQLQSIIKNKEYDRLTEIAKDKLIKNKELKVDDLIPNPILIKNPYSNDKLTEYVLKQTILNNLDEFLSQLGVGFFYVGNEYKIKLGNIYNYIDLLLFNIEYNCYIVIELKVTELKKEHIGQIQVYMNYIDENVKKFNHDKTIGIIICKYENRYIIKYSSDSRIISREYQLV